MSEYRISNVPSQREETSGVPRRETSRGDSAVPEEGASEATSGRFMLAEGYTSGVSGEGDPNRGVVGCARPTRGHAFRVQLDSHSAEVSATGKRMSAKRRLRDLRSL